jgi:hypothetical protein
MLAALSNITEAPALDMLRHFLIARIGAIRHKT